MIGRTTKHDDRCRRGPGAAFLAVVAAAVAAVGGCVEDEPIGEELAIDCTGKCDGLGSIRSLFRDARRVDLGDLLSVGAGFATDELNDALAFGGVAAEVRAPVLYALPEDAADDLTLRDIDELISGLAARYGERELTTRVNEVRRAHLGATRDDVYAEAAFRIAGGYDHGWDLPAGGLEDVVARLGFDARGELEARVIAPFDGELTATWGSMLGALRQTRGFVLPRSLGEVAEMEPGETFALRGGGRLAINVGAGVPLMLAQPVGAVSYSLVFSAALRAVVEGRLDVQLVRLGGDHVVLDVGMEAARVRSARVAVEDGWGVSGLVRLEVDLGGHTVDLGRLAERALERSMNRRLNLVSARAESTSSQTRVSVARFRFDVGRAGDANLEQALAQALRGDVRLAQALASRDRSGVEAEFDILRTGVSTVSHAGLDLFGMSFFTTTTEREGSAVAQTPGGAATFLFDSLHQERGWFFSSHGYTRVGLAGLVFDPDRPGAPTGETNLFIQLVEGDDFMERDKLLDHLDALILAVGGERAFAGVEGPGNELERFVESRCSVSGSAWDPCRTAVLEDPTVVRLRAEGAAALERETAHLEEPLRRIVLEAGTLRLTAQATLEPAAALVGPPSSVVTDFRLDDGALAHLFATTSGADLRAALRPYIGAMAVDRGDRPARIEEIRQRAIARADGVLWQMAAAFDEGASRYESLLAAETASIEGLGVIGPNAIEIRYAVDAGNRVLYEEATAQSISQARSGVAAGTFDALHAIARGLDPHPEQVVAYGLLAMVPAARTDLRFDLRMDLANNWAQPFDHYRAAGYTPLDRFGRGSSVTLMDGGLFDIDALVTVDR